jgi:hypothetical protein
MTAKQLQGMSAPDGASYGVLTTGANVLATTPTSTAHPGNTAKQLQGRTSPDGSVYFTLTNGSGSLV